MTNCMNLRYLALFGLVAIATVAVTTPVLSEATAKPGSRPVQTSRDLIDFGQIDDYIVSDHTFGITNTGDSPIQITGQLIEGPDSHRFSLLGDTSDYYIEPGSSALHTIRYNPAGRIGQDTAYWVAEVRSDSVWRITIQLRGIAIDTIPPQDTWNLSADNTSESVDVGAAPRKDKSTHFALASVRVKNIPGSADLQLTFTGNADVQVEIVDSTGLPVKALGLQEGLTGSQQFKWDCKDDSGKTMSAGRLAWRLASEKYIALIDIVPNVPSAFTITSRAKVAD